MIKSGAVSQNFSSFSETNCRFLFPETHSDLLFEASSVSEDTNWILSRRSIINLDSSLSSFIRLMKVTVWNSTGWERTKKEHIKLEQSGPLHSVAALSPRPNSQETDINSPIRAPLVGCSALMSAVGGEEDVRVHLQRLK